MKKQLMVSTQLLVFLLLSVLACNFSSMATPSAVDPKIVDTWAANTLEAMRDQATPTLAAVPTQTPEQTGSTIPATQNAVYSSSTPTFTLSVTPISSLTAFYPTTTPSPDKSLTETESTPDATATLGPSTPCNSAQFIGDVTIPDGFNIPVGLPFTKIWRIKNNGSCTWDKSYTMVFTSGDRMKATTTSLPKSIKPNEIIDIPVNMVTPSKKGSYRGNWMLHVGQTTFGGGSGGTRTFFVQIEAIPNSKQIIYNFALNFCAARWESSAGDLICPGKEGTSNGFMMMLHEAKLETRTENEPVLGMQPFSEKGGWISGTFPAIEIQKGYHFQADVGCLAGYEKCNVNFELWYRLPSSPKKKLGTWQEYHDSHLTRINIDLSPLAGTKTSFILLVIANDNPDQAAAFWLMPQIRIP